MSVVDRLHLLTIFLFFAVNRRLSSGSGDDDGVGRRRKRGSGRMQKPVSPVDAT